MKVLKGILSESKEYYLNIKAEIEKKLRSLPSGSVKERIIAGRKYYYVQRRKNEKVVHEYLGKERPDDLLKKIRERKALKAELKKVNEALKILHRAGMASYPPSSFVPPLATVRYRRITFNGGKSAQKPFRTKALRRNRNQVGTL